MFKNNRKTKRRKTKEGPLIISPCGRDIPTCRIRLMKGKKIKTQEKKCSGLCVCVLQSQQLEGRLLLRPSVLLIQRSDQTGRQGWQASEQARRSGEIDSGDVEMRLLDWRTRSRQGCARPTASSESAGRVIEDLISNTLGRAGAQSSSHLVE